MKGCNTMYVVRQADNSFVCFGAKPDKGFWTWDLGMTGSRKGTPVREWDKGTEKWAVGDGGRTEAVNTGHRSWETSHQEIGSSDSKEDRVKMSRYSSCFVEVLLEIHANVSLYMLSGMQKCYIASLLHLS